MRTIHALTTVRRWAIGLLVVCCLATTIGCSGHQAKSARRGETDTTPYMPKAEGPRLWQQASYEAVRATIPEVPDAEMIDDDELCMSCHESYVEYHHSSVHRAQSCETCHGAGSEHVRSRGKEPGLILNLKRLAPAESAEVCLKCHENNACEPGAQWRTSKHAHASVSCVNCHTGHYNVPEGTPATSVAGVQQNMPGAPATEFADLRNALPQNTPATVAVDRPQNVPSGTFVSPVATDQGQDGDVLLAHLQVEQQEADMAAIRKASRAMGARNINVCFNCHREKEDQHRVAHPHQICGAVGMTCTTCHDPHGNIREETRTDLCLKCHKGAPTMAWHSSIHSRQGVACADCHNPHPNSNVPQLVNIQHTHVTRQNRLPMAVDQPNTCYKCHSKIYAEFSMPSHHPVKEGKLVCSDCHDAHGQAEGNLKEPTLNMVCYRCHAEKQGPFVWEHPPVTENCGICHNPHGTVSNNLLRQPTTFLCLRCHAGHRSSHHVNIDVQPQLRAPFYSDCTQCHSQVHGSDLPANTRNPRMLR